MAQPASNSWRYAEDGLVIGSFLVAPDKATHHIPVMNLWDATRTLHEGTRLGDIVACVRRCVRVSSCVVKVSGLLGCLGGFGSSPRSSPVAPHSRPAVRYFLDLSSVEPIPLCNTLHGFPYSRVFYNGVSGPPQGQQSSSIFSWSSFRPDPGGPSSNSPGPSCPSVYLTDPSLAGTPRSGASFRVLSGLPVL